MWVAIGTEHRSSLSTGPLSSGMRRSILAIHEAGTDDHRGAPAMPRSHRSNTCMEALN